MPYKSAKTNISDFLFCHRFSLSLFANFIFRILSWKVTQRKNVFSHVDVNNATVKIFIIGIDPLKKKIKYPKHVRLLQSDFWRDESKYSFNAAVSPFSFLKTSCNNTPQVCGMAFTENRFAGLKTCHTAAQMSETLSSSS